LRLQRNRFGSVEALHGKVGQAQSDCHADQLNGQRVAVVELLDAATGYRTDASVTGHHVKFPELFGAVFFLIFMRNLSTVGSEDEVELL
jgi:hypothetical protein